MRKHYEETNFVVAHWARKLRAVAIIVSWAALGASLLTCHPASRLPAGQAVPLPAAHAAQLVARETATLRSTRLPWAPDSALVAALREEVVACGELTDTAGPVRWFRVGPKATVLLGGLWLPPDTIILADTAHVLMRHELRHHLLQGDARHAHPAWTRCQ